MVYTNLATSIIFNGGAGYGFNFSPEHSANALSINYLSAGVGIPVNGSISIFGNAKLENLAPLGASEKSVVGAQVEVGIKMQLPIKK